EQVIEGLVFLLLREGACQVEGGNECHQAELRCHEADEEGVGKAGSFAHCHGVLPHQIRKILRWEPAPVNQEKRSEHDRAIEETVSNLLRAATAANQVIDKHRTEEKLPDAATYPDQTE